MSDSFTDDVMDDLFYDAAEGPARYDEGDEYDAYDEGDEGDEFLRGIIGGVGQLARGLLGGGGEGYEDEYDEGDEYEDYEAYDEYDSYDDYDAGDVESWDDLVADAMDAEDTDEFLRRLRNIGRTVGRVAGRVGRVAGQVGRGVGRVARVVGPIASMIPIPQAQAIGRIANIAGRLLADGADDFDALDEMLDLADDEEFLDAAAPVVAGLTVRTQMPGAARMPRPARRQMVRNVAQATRTLARRQTGGARAVPGVVQTVQRGVRQRRIPPRAAPQAVRRVAQRVAQSPRAVRQLAQRAATAAPTIARPGAMRPRPGAGARPCPTCGRVHGRGGMPRRLRLRGPVTITIRGAR